MSEDEQKSEDEQNARNDHAAAQRLTVQDLYRALHMVSHVMDPLPLAVVGVDQESRIILSNNRTTRFFGFRPAELYQKQLNRIFPGVRLDSGIDGTGKPFAKMMRSDGTMTEHQEGRNRDGESRNFQVIAYPRLFGDGVVTFLAIRDVGEEKRTRDALKERDDVLRSVIAGLPAMVSAKDRHGRYVVMNEYQADAFGVSISQAIGKTTSDLLGEEAGAEIDQIDMKLAAGKGLTFSTEERYPDASGRQRIWQTTKSTLQDRDGAVDKVFSVSIDISEKKILEEKAESMASFDAMTGLPNRAYFMRRVKEALDQAKRVRGMAAVIMLDLSNLDEIDQSGPEGLVDFLIRRAAIRLCAAVGDEDVVARFGQGSFAILMHSVDSLEVADRRAVEISESVGTPYAYGETQVAIAPMAGTVVYPDDGLDSRDLLDAADQAIRRAKAASRNVTPFSDSLAAERSRRKDIRASLRKALEQDGFRTVLTPQVSLSDMTIRGAETAQIWDAARQDLSIGSDYLAIADEAGLTEEIGEKALRAAAGVVISLKKAGHDHITLSIPVEPALFHLPSLADLLTEIAPTGRREARQIELAVSESTVMQDPELALAIFHQIRDAGFEPTLTDFGAGPLSLQYLSLLPVRKATLGKALTEKIKSADRGLKAALLLAREFGLKTVATNVQSGEGLRILADMGVDLAQGPMIAKAGSPEVFRNLISENGGQLTA